MSPAAVTATALVASMFTLSGGTPWPGLSASTCYGVDGSIRDGDLANPSRQFFGDIQVAGAVGSNGDGVI